VGAARQTSLPHQGQTYLQGMPRVLHLAGCAHVWRRAGARRRARPVRSVATTIATTKRRVVPPRATWRNSAPIGSSRTNRANRPGRRVARPAVTSPPSHATTPRESQEASRSGTATCATGWTKLESVDVVVADRFGTVRPERDRLGHPRLPDAPKFRSLEAWERELALCRPVLKACHKRITRDN
jgi:hypothetical protein